MKKTISFSVTGIMLSIFCFSQNVGIGTTTPNSSAQLDIQSSTKGVLIPRVTTAQLNVIASPARGLMLLDTVANQLMINMGTPGTPNWQSVVVGSGWTLRGNSNTLATNFLGTADNKALSFRLNNVSSGLLDSINLFLGYKAGLNNTTGFSNIAFGRSALSQNTSSMYNIAIGDSALYKNDGVGSGIGSGNTTIGWRSLVNNYEGYSNTAIGGLALNKNTTGSINNAHGVFALFNNTTGSENTAIGGEAIYRNTTGSYNTAAGSGAMRNNTTGILNVAIGEEALYDNTTGCNLVAVGANALRNNNGGSNNTALGASADVSSVNLTNATAIGAFATVSQSNSLVLGYNAWVGIGYPSPTASLDVRTVNNSSTSIYGITISNNGNGIQGIANNAGSFAYAISGFSNTGYAGYFGGNVTVTGIFSNPSDRVLKEHIRGPGNMLAKIIQLKPSVYNYKKEYEQLNLPEGDQVGFIAQEMETIFPQLVTINMHKATDSNRSFQYKSINYIGLIPILTKGIQEQQQQIETLQKENVEIKKQLQSLQKQLEALVAKQNQNISPATLNK